MKVGNLVSGRTNIGRSHGCIGIIVDKVRPLNIAEYVIMWSTGRLSSHYPHELIIVKNEWEE